MFLWILEANKPILFRRTNVNDCFNNEGLAVKRNVAEVFGNKTFRKFNISPEGKCEDRSLFCSNVIHPIPGSSQKDDLAALRLKEDEEYENQQLHPSLAQCNKCSSPLWLTYLVKQNSLLFLITTCITFRFQL